LKNFKTIWIQYYKLAKLTKVTRERMYNVMEIGELKAQLAKQKQATENCEAMLSRMVEERNAAIAREE